MQKLILPLPPRLNSAYHPRPGGRGIFKSREAKEWEEAAGWIALEQGAICYPAHIQLELWIDQYHAREADIDSRLKVLLDGLQGILWENDKQIAALHVRNRRDQRNPRIELSVEEL